jgi:uncharacterized protein
MRLPPRPRAPGFIVAAMTRPLRDSTEAEIEAYDLVCGRLAGFDERLGLEWIDGHLTALAAGLTVPPFETWVQAMAGDAYDRAFADPEDRARAEAALGARLAVLRDQLDAESLDDAPDHLRLSPFMIPWTDEDRAKAKADAGLTDEEVAECVTGADWADGFFAGLEAHAALWPAPASDESAALMQSLAQQVHALRLPEGSDELREHLAATYGTEGADRDRLIDEACFAVQDLRLWAVDHAPRPETRRVDKTPGRNDPCPCGSGRKFKKCHGA